MGRSERGRGGGGTRGGDGALASASFLAWAAFSFSACFARRFSSFLESFSSPPAAGGSLTSAIFFVGAVELVLRRLHVGEDGA